MSTWPEASRPGDSLWVRRETRQVAIPARRQLAPLHLIDLGGELRELFAIAGEKRLPALPRRAPRAPMPAAKRSMHAVGHEELGVLRPAIGALGQPDLVLAQGLAMGRGGVDLVRRAIADVAVQNDQRRPALGLAEDRKRILDPLADRWRRRPAAHSTDRQGSAPPRPR